MESEEIEGRTLVQVISEKYSPDNFPYCRGPGVGVVIRSSPQGSPVKDRLNLPRILVLDGCGITEAGDEEEVATFCAHVVELDLSHNQLKDWGEISKILSYIPNLDFLNLSMNPLRGSSLEPGAAEAFSGLRCLVLNNTHVTWDMVHTLTQEIPELEELFLCLNEYVSVSASSVPFPSLRLLHITDNQLQEWAEVRKLGLMYPGLVSLILANNSLSAIHEPEDSLQRLFPNLRSINLHNSGLSRWEDIQKLNLFPKLQEVRVLGIPLLQPYTDQERRCLMVAQLPGVTALNGSVITDGEREDAERFFIRYYQDCPEDELPQRYHTLVARYGRLAPLAEVDLRPLCHAQVEVRFGDQTEPLELRLDQTVADLKKQLRAMIQLPPNKIRVYYIDRQLGYALEPQEMKSGVRALHSYSIRDGDQILVVPKTQ
ncbi:tubulin-specific chaperone cofactor E-like protein [Myxocyprinus asiaticus]|uniref:tubulin-specific chaperone cofactor E-like protein n=1 Tax=Myxocyprinus asiaticus TaxID=70543 RepID=UPI002221A2F9|nr:tubulin-specific chaperone cofactor E-like protein [Myxocyprinus asiaticus]XP_051552637.1 tubulin-specific chaperone cofactor E-like protein [Myxocyprinus asiaticus]XP_051552639.1 tubulin-specific chaperone cofactor E-like protein [Myxocyprinus asiaticus]XP_051552640.1 tubulin-specific chaperone cofactor E-like protein [Myxocyprinus asiaticus]